VVWTIPSPCAWKAVRCCPSSLYTFRRLAPAWLGITSEGFPEFEQFYSPGFPEGTQSF
jgi:hypothetical protein